jgi:hypothetical protein
MRRLMFVLLGLMAMSSLGCVVYDRKDAVEPIWWPTVMLREPTVQPQGGHVQVHPSTTIFPPAEPHLQLQP